MYSRHSFNKKKSSKAIKTIYRLYKWGINGAHKNLQNLIHGTLIDRYTYHNGSHQFPNPPPLPHI